MINMKISHFILLTPYLTTLGQCRMEPYVVNGQNASILQFPHSAQLFIKCSQEVGFIGVYICGSAILNQYLTLTAAHCTYKCISDTLITVYVGHVTWFQGASAIAHSFLEHEHYDDNRLHNDICLIRLTTPLKFGQNVNRVALMQNPPYNEEASAAGWGKFEVNGTQISDYLLYTSLHVKKGNECPRRQIEDPGQFCIYATEARHPYHGDSGSAIVVRNYIQIGIVSHGSVTLDPPVVFFTDTGYYYKWIQQRSMDIFCIGGGPGMKKEHTKCTIARDRRRG